MKRARLIRGILIFVTPLVVALSIDLSRPPSQQISVIATVGAINLYQQNVSGRIPFIRCRHSETCSCYCKRAFEERGFVRGLVASVARIQSCF